MKDADRRYADPAPSLVTRQRGFFYLQLCFVERLAAAWTRPISDVALQWSNLHRRLGLGTPDPDHLSADWIRFAERLDRSPSHAARLDHIIASVSAAPAPPPVVDQTAFGCFACEASDEEGQVRIHFHNRDSDDAGGPLSRGKVGRRLAELHSLVAHASLDPAARLVLGGSWLYNLEAYRRLFPGDYVRSLQVERPTVQMRGLSMWGQFLTHRGDLKTDLAEVLLARLETLDPSDPTGVFPFRKMTARAPLAAFRTFLGMDEQRSAKV